MSHLVFKQSFVLCDHRRDHTHSIVQHFKTALLSAGVAGSVLCGSLVAPPQLEAAPIASRANVTDEDLLNQLLNSGRNGCMCMIYWLYVHDAPPWSRKSSFCLVAFTSGTNLSLPIL